MLEYIYRDLVSAVRYLPYGLLIGIPLAAVLLWVCRKKRAGARLSAVVFCIYLAVMLVITFLSREVGSSSGLDLELFSTWGINKRNNAVVLENVILFIPYGLISACAFRRMKCFFCCTALGAVTSLGIESLQLVTRTGIFQIDDILTNTLGTMIGFLVYKVVCLLWRCRAGKK